MGSATLSNKDSNQSNGIAAGAASNGAAIIGPDTPPNYSPTQHGSKPQFTKSDLASYIDYCTTISNLEEQNLEALAEAQPLQIENAAMQRDVAYEKWRTAESSQLEAKKSLENLEKWSLGKFLSTKKLAIRRQEAKRIERQQQLDYTIAAVNRAFMELESAKTRLDEAEYERDSLRSRLSELYLARCNQNALVERMFSHPNYDSDPILAPLRQEIQELEQKATKICTKDGPYLKTYKILTFSLEKIHHAMQDFRYTGVMDMAVIKRGTLLLDHKHKQSIQAANELLQLVGDDVVAARKLLPVLPFNDDSLIESALTGIFAPIMSPDFVGNAEGQRSLKKCMEKLVQLKKEVLNCLQYAQRNLTRDTDAPILKQLRVLITAKKEKMAEYQHSLLQAALKDM
jgi:hypothetical protein